MPYLRLRIRHHFLRAVLAQPQSVSVHVLVCRKDSVLLQQPGLGAGAPLGARRLPCLQSPPRKAGACGSTPVCWGARLHLSLRKMRVIIPQNSWSMRA